MHDCFKIHWFFQGVIFNINVNYSSQLICSVSDDRSILLWRWSYPEGSDSWETARFDLVSTFLGHTSRVWDARILDNQLISIGEDALLMVWDLNGALKKSVKTHKVRITRRRSYRLDTCVCIA